MPSATVTLTATIIIVASFVVDGAYLDEPYPDGWVVTGTDDSVAACIVNAEHDWSGYAVVPSLEPVELKRDDPTPPAPWPPLRDS